MCDQSVPRDPLLWRVAITGRPGRVLTLGAIAQASGSAPWNRFPPSCIQGSSRWAGPLRCRVGAGEKRRRHLLQAAPAAESSARSHSGAAYELGLQDASQARAPPNSRGACMPGLQVLSIASVPVHAAETRLGWAGHLSFCCIHAHTRDPPCRSTQRLTHSESRCGCRSSSDGGSFPDRPQY